MSTNGNGQTVLLDDDNEVEYITGQKILLNGELKCATIKIQDGKIVEIFEGNYILETLNCPEKIIDASNLVVMPGLFDSHVHVNEPGRTEWEGFWTATRAAAAGGITTLIDMPLNSIPSTTTVDNLNIKLKAAKGKCHIDVGFWGGVVPDNSESLRPMIEIGAIGFKCFLIHSGIDDFPCVTEADVDIALSKLQGTGKVLAFHAEVDCGGDDYWHEGNPSLYKTFLNTRPSDMEMKAAEIIERLCRKHKNVRCHIVHLSSANSLPLISKLKQEGYPITVETCPHYLTLTAEDICDKRTEFKCCPPIRDSKNQAELWEGIRSGLIDMIVSDHSPCTPDLKRPGEHTFLDAWGGISSVQFGLPIIWTAASKYGFGIADICRLMSEEPAKLAKFDKIKSKLAVGYNADIVIWDPEEEIEITESIIEHRNKITPYKGKKFKGRVHWTILSGKIIYDHGSFSSASGKLLVRDKV